MISARAPAGALPCPAPNGSRYHRRADEVNRLTSKELHTSGRPPEARVLAAVLTSRRSCASCSTTGPALRDPDRRRRVRPPAGRRAGRAVSAGRDALTLFSSSWKDRLRRRRRPRRRASPTSGCRSALLNVAVAPAGLAAGRAAGRRPVRHRPVGAPAAHAVAARGARLVTIHDLDFLDHPERTRAEIRRDYARAGPPPRATRPTTSSPSRPTRPARSRRGSACPGTGSPSAARARRPGRVRMAPPPASLGYLLFVGTLEPRKNVGVLLDAYGRLIARNPQAPPLVLAGRDGRRIGAGARRARPASPLAGRVQHLGYIADDERAALYAGAHRARPAVVHSRASACPCSRR